MRAATRVAAIMLVVLVSFALSATISIAAILPHLIANSGDRWATGLGVGAVVAAVPTALGAEQIKSGWHIVTNSHDIVPVPPPYRSYRSFAAAVAVLVIALSALAATIALTGHNITVTGNCVNAGSNDTTCVSHQTTEGKR